MSSTPSSSNARAQSIDSAIDGGFFRSSSRTMPITSTNRRATCLFPRSGRVQAHDLELVLELGVVQPEVQTAALERLGQLARVVRGQQHHGVGTRLERARARGSRSESPRAPPAASPRTPGWSCRSRRSAARPAARRAIALISGRASRNSSPKMSSCTASHPAPSASAWMRSSCLR